MAKKQSKGKKSAERIWKHDEDVITPKNVIDECGLKTRVVYDLKMMPRGYVCSQMTKEDIKRTAQQYLDIINCTKVTKDIKKDIVRHTLENFDTYFNKGVIEYRKSVAEAEQFAAIEWEGKGSVIKDLFGRKYIDFLGGYGIYNMGIKHPKIVKAVMSQLKRMPLSSQELLDPLRGALSQLLGELTPGDLQECFFINNGTDAVEGAMKLARMYTGKSGFISTLKGFHGKSFGSLSLMGKAEYRKPFEPLLSNVHFVPFGDADALEDELKKMKAIGRDIAAFVAEPVQGEAGAIVPPDNYFQKVRKLCDEYGILFIADEVQTGMGRTGKIFAVEHWNVVPDIMCLGKSLGGGVMPLSAFISNKKVWSVLEKNPFLHSSTFGGNPLACAAGIAAINVMLEEKLPEQAAEKGDYMLKNLRKMQKSYKSCFTDVHGKGLLIGMDFVDDDFGYKVASGLFRRGILVAGTLISSKTIRVEPALNIPWEYLDLFLEKLPEVLDDAVEKSEE